MADAALQAAAEADGARLTDREARRVEPLVAGRTLQDAEDSDADQDGTIVDRCLEVSATLGAAIAYARQLDRA